MSCSLDVVCGKIPIDNKRIMSNFECYKIHIKYTFCNGIFFLLNIATNIQNFCIILLDKQKTKSATKGILNGLLFDINYINTIYPENDIDMYLK